jgi:hypothetical protein
VIFAAILIIELFIIIIIIISPFASLAEAGWDGLGIVLL